MDLIRSQSAEIRHATALTSALKVERQGSMVALHIERSVPHVTVLLDFEKQIFTNSITYECSAFVLIDILWSNDGKSFYRTHGITHENRGDIKKFSFPLIGARYFQVHLYQEGGLLHKNEVRRFEIGFLSQAKVRASTELDRLWVADNLTDRREDYGWASKVHEKDEGDTIDVDLGALFFVKEIQLKSIADEFNFFPVAFQLQLSEDNAVWHTLASEDRFYAGPTTWHAWWFAPTRARYARVQINKHAHYKKGEYQSKILDIAVLAEPEAYSAIGKERDNFTRMASENIAGLVLLSPNNISAPNRVVQSNDSRLRNATTEYRGIMQFARDNEAAQEKAVQGNDSRLRTATEVNPGIVQLAKSGEDRELTAVQGSDVRLKQATQDSVGIVQLAKDGEAKPGVVVQGNDVRLKSASHNSFGLVQLAKDGETTQGKVIQASDFRLRTASQSWPGIIQIAAHSEIASNKAVAADDPRLQEGDESHKGGVQFARKGEIADLKAVQASDPRLHTATEENIGVVQFARSGTSAVGKAVQSTDSRLSDPREAKPHQHSEYAVHGHEFNSHSGNIDLKRAQKTEAINLTTAPVDTQIPLLVQNTEGLAAVISGGAVFASDNVASTHIAKNAPALQAASQNGAAAVLLSNNAYALHLPRTHLGVRGSEKAILAEGKVEVDGHIVVKNAGSISVALPKASNEAFVDGDLITIDNGVASKMRQENQPLVGVVSKEAALQLESGQGALKVAVAGVVSLRVHGQVKAGDKLALNTAQAGTCKVGQGQEKFFAVALEASTNDREKSVLAILVR